MDFVFSIYDSDGNGRLGVDECIEIIRDVCGMHYDESTNARK